MDAERWAISVVGQGVRGGVATGKMPSFERDQATCHVRITATARLSQRAAKDPERLHGNAAPMFYCGWSVMPLTVASECSQSQLVPREIGRKQGFLGCSFSLGEVPAAPASRCLSCRFLPECKLPIGAARGLPRPNARGILPNDWRRPALAGLRPISISAPR